MIICQCNIIKDCDVRSAISSLRARQPDQTISPTEIYDWLDKKPDCGKCERLLNRLIDSANSQHQEARRPEIASAPAMVAAE